MRQRPQLLIREDLQIIGADSQAVDFFDFNLDKLLTINLSKLLVNEDCSQFVSLRNGNQASNLTDISLITGAEEKRLVDLRTNLFHYQDQNVIQLTIVTPQSDIIELKNRDKLVKSVPKCDLLTGLLDRDSFIDKLEELLLEADKEDCGETIEVLFIDVDNFKKVNDSLGRKAGDKLLNKVAQRLKSCIKADDVLARLNGDEFGLIIDTQDLENIRDRIQQITEIFSQPFILETPWEEQRKIFVTVSIGITVYPDDSRQAEQLLKNAETAMHKAKEKGTAHYCFYADKMNEEILREVELETRLRQALEREEFILYYQPQININNSQICGLEALIRWRDPELGLVSPGEFIPLAEKTGLIISIGEWVLKTACRQIKKLHQQGFSDLKLGVNLSARQFQDYELIKKIDKSLKAAGLPPEYLELEITESMIMDDIEGSIDKLFKLKERGVKFSIDDFGTGYSSLSYLKRFPIETLKIDRSFVNDAPDNSDDTAIVKAIIDLAHNLNLNVVAEGAETIDQIKFLKANNCDQVQGYYYSRPLPQDKIIDFISYKG